MKVLYVVIEIEVAKYSGKKNASTQNLGKSVARHFKK